MAITVKATEAKNTLGALLKAISQDEDETVVIVSHGAPAAVIVSPASFQAFQEMKEQRKRQEAWQRFHDLADRLADRTTALTDEAIENLADRATMDAVEALAAKGETRFEER